jgi:hypothetical protein
MARRGTGSKNEDKEELPREHRPTNKASIGRKAALGLRQIAALMAPSVSTQSQSLLRAPSCRQCGNFLRLSNVGGHTRSGMKKRTRAIKRKTKKKGNIWLIFLTEWINRISRLDQQKNMIKKIENIGIMQRMKKN